MAVKLHRNRIEKAQALAEFSLVFPYLLLLSLGIADFGRAIFAYTQASYQLREALRYGAITDANDGTPNYQECLGMSGIVRNVWFASSQSVLIQFINQDDPNPSSPTPIVCLDTEGTPPPPDWNDVDDLDLLQIHTQVTVKMLTPVFPPELEFVLEGQRTIVNSIVLSHGPDDTDNDGLQDSWEMTWFGDLDEVATTDGEPDGCNLGCEEIRGTDPTDADTDDDGLSDGQEAYTYGTNPLNPDHDGDNLLDGEEVFTYGTSPFLKDTDADTVDDDVEIANGTDPLNGPVLNAPVLSAAPEGSGTDCTALISTDRFIGLEWTPSTDTYGYYVYNTDTGVLIASYDATGFSCGNMVGGPDGCFSVDSTPWSPLYKLSYQVVPYFNLLLGTPSNTVTIRCSPIDTVTNLEAQPAGTTSCTYGGSTPPYRYEGLQWVGAVGVDGYHVYADDGITKTLVGDIAGYANNQCGPTSFANCFNASPGVWSFTTVFRYTVAAYVDGLDGAESNPVDLICDAPPP